LKKKPFHNAINLLKDKKIHVTDIIDAEFPLANAIEAFKFAGEPGTLKVLLTP